MNLETAILLISTLGGLELVKYLVNLFVNRKNERRKNNAEAEKAEADVDDAEVKRLHGEIDHMQVIINNLTELDKTHTKRMSELNAAIDKHIDRNRELSDRLYQSESELNRRNERIEELTKEVGNERLQRQYFEVWRCERTDCKDHRGPKPPRDKLKGMKYEKPKPCGGCEAKE